MMTKAEIELKLYEMDCRGGIKTMQDWETWFALHQMLVALG